MTAQHQHPSSREASTLLPVLSPERPYTQDVPEEELRDLCESITGNLLDYAEDPYGQTLYGLARRNMWRIVLQYRTEADTLSLGSFCRLICQVENYLWSLPSAGDEGWDEQICQMAAARLLNGVLQTIRPDFFAQEKEKQSSFSPLVVGREQLERLAMEAQALANWLAVKEMVDDCYGEGRKVSKLMVQINFDGVETSLDWILAYDQEGHIISFDRSLPIFAEDIALLPGYSPHLLDEELLFWIDNRYGLPRVSTIYTLDHPPTLTFTVETTAPEKEDHTQ